MKQETSSKRFVSLKRDRGIRKDLKTGNYVATKQISGTRKSKTFPSLAAARKWQREYEEDQSLNFHNRDSITFKQAWDRYLREFVVTLAKSSQDSLKERSKQFADLYDYEMSTITPHIITDHLLYHKELAIKTENNKRCNFDHELKLISAFFNWYREVIDYTYINPVLKRHRQIAKVRDTKFKDKKMSPDQILLFLDTIKENPFWYQFAVTQFYFAGRVQEIAGLQRSSVSLSSRTALIKDVAVWGKNKAFEELKSLPKNGELRTVYLNDSVFEVLKSRLESNDPNCSFVFNIYGRPLKYREIQHQYNKALKQCGLYPRFSGTHFMRHSMATITRQVTKSLELTQSITGHRDQKLVQHYAYMDSDNNKLAQNKVENFLLDLQCSQQCEQMRTTCH